MRQLIVFTDLDGTLLDHDTYRFDAAKKALDQLRRDKIPLIINSSKTMAEVLQIKDTLENPDPFIVENGSLIAVPENYFEALDRWSESSYQLGYPGYRVERLGGDRDRIVALLRKIRSEMDVKFIGFADMTVDALMDCTGLSREGAALAQKRGATEPILWQDSHAAFDAFTHRLQAEGLQWVQGGRFISISEPFDKRDGVQRLIALYQKALCQRENDLMSAPEITFSLSSSPVMEGRAGGEKMGQCMKELFQNDRVITVALGDSPNDQGMLDTVDIAVIIKSDRSDKIELHHPKWVIRTTRRGPQGWQEAMDKILPKCA